MERTRYGLQFDPTSKGEKTPKMLLNQVKDAEATAWVKVKGNALNGFLLLFESVTGH
jgi:hypothetical protein